MIAGSKTLETLRALYHTWIDRDYFLFAEKPAHARPPSIRHFIHYLALGNTVVRQHPSTAAAVFPDLTDLDIPFSAFLEMSVRVASGDTSTIGSYLFRHFCIEVIPELAQEIAASCDDEREKTALLAEAGAGNWQAWVQALSEDENAEPIADALFEDLVARIRDRTLYSFFVAERSERGYYSAWEAAVSAAGRPLRTHHAEIAGGRVTIEVARYGEREEEGSVTAYEWSALLRQNGHAEPLAYACGMVYAFDRENGQPLGGKSDLLQAADQVADTDLLQVNAFLTQHKDAEDVMRDADLCFVWLWERHADAPHGLGAACLEAAIADLKKRFGKIGAVIVDTRPMQFRSWDLPNDPPMVTVEKQNAIDALVSYIGKLKLKAGVVRHIFNLDEDDPMAALAVLGMDAIEGKEPARAPVSGALGWEAHADDLAMLLSHAGLGELSRQVEAMEADDYEIRNALTAIVLHQRIPYLPLAVTPDLDVKALFDDATDGSGALDDAEVRVFIDSLPPDVDFRRAIWCSDEHGSGPGWVIAVVAETAFCALEAFFTLTPAPRPVDPSRIMN